MFVYFNNHLHGCYMAYKRQGLVEPSTLANSNLVNSKISVGQNYKMRRRFRFPTESAEAVVIELELSHCVANLPVTPFQVFPLITTLLQSTFSTLSLGFTPDDC